MSNNNNEYQNNNAYEKHVEKIIQNYRSSSLIDLEVAFLEYNSKFKTFSKKSCSFPRNYEFPNPEFTFCYFGMVQNDLPSRHRDQISPDLESYEFQNSLESPESLKKCQISPLFNEEMAKDMEKQNYYLQMEKYLNKAKEDIAIAVHCSLESCQEYFKSESTYQSSKNKRSKDVQIPKLNVAQCRCSKSENDYLFSKKDFIPLYKRFKDNSEIPESGRKSFYCHSTKNFICPPANKLEVNNDASNSVFYGSLDDDSYPKNLKDSSLQEWSDNLMKNFLDVVDKEIRSLSQSKNCISESHSKGAIPKCSFSRKKAKFGEGMGSNHSKFPDSWTDDCYPHVSHTLPNSSRYCLYRGKLKDTKVSDFPSFKNSCQLTHFIGKRFSRSLSLEEGQCMYSINQIEKNDCFLDFSRSPKMLPKHKTVKSIGNKENSLLKADTNVANAGSDQIENKRQPSQVTNSERIEMIRNEPDTLLPNFQRLLINKESSYFNSDNKRHLELTGNLIGSGLDIAGSSPIGTCNAEENKFDIKFEKQKYIETDLDYSVNKSSNGIKDDIKLNFKDNEKVVENSAKIFDIYSESVATNDKRRHTYPITKHRLDENVKNKTAPSNMFVFCTDDWIAIPLEEEMVIMENKPILLAGSGDKCIDSFNLTINENKRRAALTHNQYDEGIDEIDAFTNNDKLLTDVVHTELANDFNKCRSKSLNSSLSSLSQVSLQGDFSDNDLESFLSCNDEYKEINIRNSEPGSEFHNMNAEIRKTEFHSNYVNSKPLILTPKLKRSQNKIEQNLGFSDGENFTSPDLAEKLNGGNVIEAETGFDKINSPNIENVKILPEKAAAKSDTALLLKVPVFPSNNLIENQFTENFSSANEICFRNEMNLGENDIVNLTYLQRNSKRSKRIANVELSVDTNSRSINETRMHSERDLSMEKYHSLVAENFGSNSPISYQKFEVSSQLEGSHNMFSSSSPQSLEPINFSSRRTKDAITQTDQIITEDFSSPSLSFSWLSDSGTYECDAISLGQSNPSIDVISIDERSESKDSNADANFDIMNSKNKIHERINDQSLSHEADLTCKQEDERIISHTSIEIKKDCNVNQSSSNSSSPETRISIDGHFQSMSESLENFDQNGESGIGTASTRPSVSPVAIVGHVDCYSESNLSSDDTGLETTFERKNHYRQNSKNKMSPTGHSLIYRKHKTHVCVHDSWVKKDSQMTQTDPDRFSRTRADDKKSPRNSQSCSERTSQFLPERKFSKPTSLNLRLASSFNEELLVNSPSPVLMSKSFCGSSGTHQLPKVSETTHESGKTNFHKSRPKYLLVPQSDNIVSFKAASAPLLEKNVCYPCKPAVLTPSDDYRDFAQDHSSHIANRTHSAKQLSEIEALEACKWLRAAGFPQYAQMYEDLQFPLDLVSVERDHSFLDLDSIQTLFRRLQTLNKCAKIKIDLAKQRNGNDDSDEENECALSQNWTYERDLRRWSRLDPAVDLLNSANNDLFPNGLNRGLENLKPETRKICLLNRSSSERLKSGAKAIYRRIESFKNRSSLKRNRELGLVIGNPKVLDEDNMKGRIQRLACVDISPEILRKSNQTLTKSCQKNMDNLKVLTENVQNNGKNDEYHTRNHCNEDGSFRRLKPSLRKIAPVFRDKKYGSTEDTSSLTSEFSQNSPASLKVRRKRPFWKPASRIGSMDGESCSRSPSEHQVFVHSDSECSPTSCRNYTFSSWGEKSASSSKNDVSLPKKKTNDDFRCENYSFNSNQSIPENFKENYHNSLDENVIEKSENQKSKELKDALHSNCSSGFLNRREVLRKSVYDNVPHAAFLSPKRELQVGDLVYAKTRGSCDSVKVCDESGVLAQHEPSNNLRKARLNRWHSFNRKSSSKNSYKNSSKNSTAANSTLINNFSVGQMNHLRKRALLKLTATMERFCPSNKNIWHWDLPKFLKKIKTPDYKDKKVFGVPLNVIFQTTGHILPPGIQNALAYLRTNCLEQEGLFRKAGVKSRIQKLRDMHEISEEIDYSNFGSFDVADVVKCYFRELPQILLTNKLSEIFVVICQYFPVSIRLEALQCAMLLLPDEHREVTLTLLTFLSEVAGRASVNQMTPKNLSICMVPSLFSFNSHSSQSTPLKKSLGCPEQKDFQDNNAAVHCFTLMIEQVSSLQHIPMEILKNCRFSYLELSRPLTLNDLGQSKCSPKNKLKSSPNINKNITKDNSNINNNTKYSPNKNSVSKYSLNHISHNFKNSNSKERIKKDFSNSESNISSSPSNYTENVKSNSSNFISPNSEEEPDWAIYMNACIDSLLKETKEKCRGWVSVNSHSNSHVEISYQKLADGHPLRLWKVSTEIEAPPSELMNRILRERHVWDENLIKWRLVTRLNENSEVFQYTTNSIPPRSVVDYCVLRCWRRDIGKGVSVIVETSVEHGDAHLTAGSVRGVVLASRYVIQPCGSGKSRITHISRVDMCGRLPEWYNKNYAHYAANHIIKLRLSFRHFTAGPESNV